MMKRLFQNLGWWILVAMIAGIVAGIVMGGKASVFAPLGTLFIQLIKMLVVPLVGVSIISGAASLGSSRSAGRTTAAKRCSTRDDGDSDQRNY